MLCIWRGELERCHYALVRFMYEAQDVLPKAVQALFVGWSGCVLFRSYRGDTAHLAEPTNVQTSVKAMEQYFIRRLMLVGGDAEAYEALGQQKPLLVQQEGASGDPGKERELGELYIRAAKLLSTTADDLQKRYAHLNRGLQAMNLRNRLRAKGHNV